jgi:hypothetical protein
MEVKFRTELGPADPARLIIVSDDRWHKYWEQLRENQLRFVTPPPGQEPPRIPAVDFGRYELIVAGAGIKPMGGYAVSIESISEKDRSIWVTVAETVPGPLCAGVAMRFAPVVIVQIPVTRKPVDFITVTKAMDCS